MRYAISSSVKALFALRFEHEGRSRASVCFYFAEIGNKCGLNPYVLMFLPFGHIIVYLVSPNSLILYAIYMYELSLFMYLLFLVLFMSFIYLSTIYWHVLLADLIKLFF